MGIKTLEEKLNIFRPNYPNNRSSVGSLLYFGIFSEEYGIKLNTTEYQMLGLMVKSKMELDFNSSVNFSFSTLKEVYGNDLILPEIDKTTIYTSPKDFYNNMAKLYLKDNYYKKNGNSSIARKNIDKINKFPLLKDVSNKPIEIYRITKEDLIKLNPDKKKEEFNSFSNLRIRKKSLESLFLKDLIRISKLINPKKKNTNPENLKYNLNSKNIYSSFISFMGSVYLSNESFHKTIRNIDYLIDLEHHGFLKKEFGHQFIELAGDIILNDSGGSTFVIEDTKIYDKIKQIYKRGISPYSPFEYEDFLSKGEKDMSIVGSYLSHDESSYFEMRLKFPWIDIEGDFGRLSHNKYKKKELSEFLEIYSKSEFLQNSLKKLTKICPEVNIENVLK